MELIQQIRQAIQEHKNIELIYDHQRRIVSPHILGRSTADHTLLSGFQSANFDDPTFEPHWRTFDLEKIEDLTITDKRFHPRHDYNPRDKNFTLVMFQI